MVRAIFTVLLAILVAAAPSAQSERLTPEPGAAELKGKLYRSVLFSGPGALADADLKTLPADVRPRLEGYLKRRAAFASKLQSAATDFDALRSEAKKRVVERAIVALIDAPDIEQAAAAYVEKAVILYEWRGVSESPLSEAAAAEDFLKKDPSSVIAPYLYIFIAERQRAAFEMMNVAVHKAEMTAASRKYRTFVQRARSAEDPIFRLLANDMDRQPYLYVKSEHHPRDFDPDT
jgi:hypothetical protein